MESRIHGDVYVRFGGEYVETYRPKGRQGAMCLACGTGKTLIMCIAAFEMKRLGLANKPMIIGLKSNVHDIADTFKRSYPITRKIMRNTHASPAGSTSLAPWPSSREEEKP